MSIDPAFEALPHNDMPESIGYHPSAKGKTLSDVIREANRCLGIGPAAEAPPPPVERDEPGDDEPGMRWVRDVFTGKYKQVPIEGGGRKVIARTHVSPHLPRKSYGNPEWRKWRSRSLSISPLEVETMNEQAKKHQTGAYYLPDGTLVADSRQARNREAARRGYGDADASYNDPVPPTEWPDTAPPANLAELQRRGLAR